MRRASAAVTAREASSGDASAGRVQAGPAERCERPRAPHPQTFPCSTPGSDLERRSPRGPDLASAFRHRRSRPTDGTGGDASRAPPDASSRLARRRPRPARARVASKSRPPFPIGPRADRLPVAPNHRHRAKRRCRAPRSRLPRPGRWAAPDDAGSARDGRLAGRRSPDDDATPGRAAGRSSRRTAAGRASARGDGCPAGRTARARDDATPVDDAPATDGSRDAPWARRDGTADHPDVADARRRRRSAPDRVDADAAADWDDADGYDAAGAPARSARRGSNRRRRVEL